MSKTCKKQLKILFSTQVEHLIYDKKDAIIKMKENVMVNYRAILLYYHQGNTTTQIATICECSRTTVIKTIKRAKQLDLKLPIADSISDQELYVMLYPKRGRRKENASKGTKFIFEAFIHINTSMSVIIGRCSCCDTS